jgi:hypothetical protein
MGVRALHRELPVGMSHAASQHQHDPDDNFCFHERLLVEKPKRERNQFFDFVQLVSIVNQLVANKTKTRFSARNVQLKASFEFGVGGFGGSRAGVSPAQRTLEARSPSKMIHG